MRVVRQAQHYFRSRRKQLFLQVFDLERRSELKILDLGGTPQSSSCSELYHHEVTYLNIVPSAHVIDHLHPKHKYICADARSIPCEDQAFNLVFSNSVIEHIGNFEQQMRVSDEIRRVGQAYWIQTPYKHFPIEPHYNFPGFQYLPDNLKKIVHEIWPFSWTKYWKLEYEEIFSLNIQQMKKLFYDGTIHYEKLGVLIKSLIAIKT